MARKPRKTPEDEATHTCAVERCGKPAPYKAPVSQQALKDYIWLCLEHVQEYNKKWDYFNGRSQDEIEQFMHDAVTGHRPTWERESHLFGKKKSVHTERLQEELRRFFNWDGRQYSAKARKNATKVEKALAVLSLDPPSDAATVKTQYRKLVKQYHPDLYQGKKEQEAQEEKFKEITAAYKLLMQYYKEKP